MGSLLERLEGVDLLVIIAVAILAITGYEGLRRFVRSRVVAGFRGAADPLTKAVVEHEGRIAAVTEAERDLRAKVAIVEGKATKANERIDNVQDELDELRRALPPRDP